MNKVIDDILVEATILGMMSEASSYEDFVNQKMPGLDNKQVKVGTALTYKTHKDFNQRQDKQKVYMDAVQNLQSGIESGQIKKSQVPDEYSAELKRKSGCSTRRISYSLFIFIVIILLLIIPLISSSSILPDTPLLIGLRESMDSKLQSNFFDIRLVNSFCLNL